MAPSCSDPWASPSFSSLNDWGPRSSVLGPLESLFPPLFGVPMDSSSPRASGPVSCSPFPMPASSSESLSCQNRVSGEKRKSPKNLGQRCHLHHGGTCPSPYKQRPHGQWCLSHPPWNRRPISGSAYFTTDEASSLKTHQHHPGPRAAEARDRPSVRAELQHWRAASAKPWEGRESLRDPTR